MNNRRNAAVRPIERPESPTIGDTQTDGSIVISKEQISRFWPGDPFKARREVRRILRAEREPGPIYGPTEKPANVRVASEEDTEAVLELVMMELREAPSLVAPINEKRVVEQLVPGLGRQGAIIGVIDGPDGRPVATIGIYLQRWWWSEAMYYQDQFCYVHPDHRNGNHYAEDLIQFSKWAADYMTGKMGYRFYVLLGLIGMSRIRQKVRFFARHVTQAGGFFIYPWPRER